MPRFRQRDVQNPHFRLPFAFGGINGGAFVNEQDSGDDIQDCVRAILAFPIGSRQELPAFGRPGLDFQEVSASMTPDQVWSAIKQWEGRAALDLSGSGDFAITDDFIESILVRLGVTDA